MTTETHREAVDLLQELGLKEYEAESYAALARMERATAKEISEHSDVPRTRVHDAIRILESRGLVGVQHTSPQQFRAVSVGEAVDIIDRQYDSKMSTLRDALVNLEPIESGERQTAHEGWSLADSHAIATPTVNMLDTADEEVVLVLGSERFLTDDMVDQFETTLEDCIPVIVGALTETLELRVQDRLPEADVFVSGLEWLRGDGAEENLAIGRMLLVDHEAILVSTFHTNGEQVDEQAIFGGGFENGLVVHARRLVATGRFGNGGVSDGAAATGEEEA
jgi:sugar-specific transcriptional regulator TrmB